LPAGSLKPVDPLDDSDNDTVCDSADLCPGADDRLDQDGDGAADACDPCSDDNPDDSDADTVCDSADQCPDDDDRLDTNADGVPDCSQVISTLSVWGLTTLALLLLTSTKLRRPRIDVRTSTC